MAIWDILPQLKCARIFYLGWGAFRGRIAVGGPCFLKKMMVTILYREEKVLCFCHKEIVWNKAALLGYQVSSQLWIGTSYIYILANRSGRTIKAVGALAPKYSMARGLLPPILVCQHFLRVVLSSSLESYCNGLSQCR